MNEYIIVNKTSILKRIGELEDERDGFTYNPNKTEDSVCYNSKIRLLKQIVSQSTPLIPEIEKAFDAGQFEEYKEISFDGGENYETIRVVIEKQDYISNLKIEI